MAELGASNNGVNVSRLIQNMLYSGFSPRDCISEDVDNSLDAFATQIHLIICDENNTLYIADNGCGMTDAILRSSSVLHQSSENGVSGNARNGRFGIGGKAAKITYTQNKFPTTTISKVEGKSLYEIELDWPGAIINNSLQIAPHRITEEGRQLWDKYKITDEKGTLICIPCEKSIFDLIKGDILSDGLVKYLGEKYHQYLMYRDITMKLFINDQEFPVIGIDVMCLDVVDTSHILRQTLEVWVENDTKQLLVYFKNGKNKMVYLDTYTNPRKPKQVQNAYPPENATAKSKLPIVSAYDPSWLPNNSSPPLGCRFIMRGQKVIDKFERIMVTSGDYACREIITYSKHMITCYPLLDSDFGIQINKSHIKEGDINFHLNETIKYVTDDFAKQLYKSYYKPLVEEPAPAPLLIPVPRQPTVLPQATPSVPQATPSVPQATSSVPQATPSVPQATPSVPQATSSVPQATPSVPQATSSILPQTSTQTSTQVPTVLTQTSTQVPTVLPQTPAILSSEETIVPNTVVINPTPTHQIDKIQFDISSRPQELIVLDISNPQQELVIVRLPTYGKGAQLREWLMARFEHMRTTNSREHFITFVKLFADQLC